MRILKLSLALLFGFAVPLLLQVAVSDDAPIYALIACLSAFVCGVMATLTAQR